MTHLDDEQLSTLIDGQLDVKASVEARVHLASCRQCQDRLKELSNASEAFRRSGVQAAPEGLIQRVNNEVSAKTNRRILTLAGAAAVVAVVIGVGLSLKAKLPTFFTHIQGLITGGAATMGSQGK